MDLTGYMLDVASPHASLEGHVAVAITDALNGAFSGRIVWQDDMPTGAHMTFQLRISNGALKLTTPSITVRVEQ